MKKLLIISFCLFSLNCIFAQNKKAAEELVEIGINYHDKGDYKGAIAKYDEALRLDKNNFHALSEKAFSLIAIQKFQDAVECSQKAIQLHPEDPNLGNVYVTLGNAYDGLLKTDKSIDIYDEGIKLFPDYFMLYFNKGITLSSVKRYKEAISCFEKAVQLNPTHVSSQNALGRLLYIVNEKIPSLMAYGRFLTLEQKTKRATENLESLKNIVKGTAEKTGTNSVNITLNGDMFKDSTFKRKSQENDFSSAELMLNLSGALDFEKKNKNKTPIELFTDKIETLCSTLSETKQINKGFYWDYYAPYYISMQQNKLIEPFVHIIFASSQDAENEKWLSKHKPAVSNFYFWTKTYKWPK